MSMLSSEVSASKTLEDSVSKALLEKFDRHSSLIATYGSRVSPQSNNENPGMLDVLVAVDSPYFHENNMFHGGKADYSDLIQHMYPLRMRNALLHFLQHIGGHIYYIRTKIAGIDAKCGIINTDELTQSLKTLESSFCAGRLSKPVHVIKATTEIEQSMNHNHKNMLSIARLLLPPSFTEQELYKKIASLSYIGDIRMQIGAEDPRKIQGIVDGNISGFREIYEPLLQELSDSGEIEVREDKSVVQHAYPDNTDLPEALTKSSRAANPEQTMADDYRDILYFIETLSSQQKKESLLEIIKGLVFYTNPRDATRYIRRKLQKGKVSR